MRSLQREKKCDEVVVLAVAQTELKTIVVEVDDRIEIVCEAIVKVRGACRETPQYRALEAADVAPIPGDERASGIGGLHDERWIVFVAQCVERHVRRTAQRVGEADVERRRNGVVA